MERKHLFTLAKSLGVGQANGNMADIWGVSHSLNSVFMRAQECKNKHWKKPVITPFLPSVVSFYILVCQTELASSLHKHKNHLQSWLSGYTLPCLWSIVPYASLIHFINTALNYISTHNICIKSAIANLKSIITYKLPYSMHIAPYGQLSNFLTAIWFISYNGNCIFSQIEDPLFFEKNIKGQIYKQLAPEQTLF